MSTSADFQFVSISPKKVKIKKGGQTTIVCDFKNNGPDEIPAKEVKVHCTINGSFLQKPKWASSLKNTTNWKLEIIQLLNGNYELFAVNKKPLGVNQTTTIEFTVKGKGTGIADITGVSSPSATASWGDVDGANQSATCQLEVE